MKCASHNVLGHTLPKTHPGSCNSSRYLTTVTPSEQRISFKINDVFTIKTNLLRNHLMLKSESFILL